MGIFGGILKGIGKVAGHALAGPALGVAGDLVGGFLNNREAKKQRKANSIAGRVADAKAAGIHPLVALGASPAGGFAQPVSPWGNAIGDAFDRTGRGLSDYANNRRSGKSVPIPRPRPDPLDRLYKQSMIDEVRSRTHLNQARLKALGGPGNVSSDVITNPEQRMITFGSHGDIIVGPGARQREVEDTYGGLVGEVYGSSKFLYDLNRSVNMRAPRPRPRPTRRSRPVRRGYNPSLR